MVGNIPEEYGGSDFGVAGMGLFLKSSAFNSSPMFSTAVVCASLIKEAGNEDQKEYLTKIASGDITLAFALKSQVDTLLFRNNCKRRRFLHYKWTKNICS